MSCSDSNKASLKGIDLDSASKLLHRRLIFERGCDELGVLSFRDYLDLFKFSSFKTKKSRHIDDLIRTYEVSGLRAEFLYTGSKLAALHCFRKIQAKTASTVLGAKQAEVANNHLLPFCYWVVPDNECA